MSYEIQVKEVPDRLVASVRRRASMATVGKEVSDAFHELWEAVEPVGPGLGMPGIEFLGDVGPETEWDMEIFLPVDARFEPPKGMRVRVLPGGTYTSTIHRGPYDACGPAYDALRSWIDRMGHRITGPPRELYLNDPDEAGQEAALTEILFPIG
jgi:effector-binding domain-containing protein